MAYSKPKKEAFEFIAGKFGTALARRLLKDVPDNEAALSGVASVYRIKDLEQKIGEKEQLLQAESRMYVHAKQGEGLAAHALYLFEKAAAAAGQNKHVKAVAKEATKDDRAAQQIAALIGNTLAERLSLLRTETLPSWARRHRADEGAKARREYGTT